MVTFVWDKFVAVIFCLLLHGRCCCCFLCGKAQLVHLPDFDNLFVNEHLLWNDQMDSVVACVSRCFFDTRCRSVQVDRISSRCSGHATAFASPTKIYPPPSVSQHSRLYLLPRAAHFIGSACTSDGDCHLATSVCNDGVCTCKIGYWFSPSQQACVTKCFTLASGLVRYPGHAIWGNDLSKHQTLGETSCPQLCTGTCPSIEFDRVKNRCIINNDTFLSVGATNQAQHAQWVYYQRHCAT
ncbi:uncharacterized protein [Haliotis asinina]|uniref:uncharacterized protein n=1 Tax=Haliotis asinina TaxID=109174 RepID=UPI0035320038